jgi:hypothetical protein
MVLTKKKKKQQQEILPLPPKSFLRFGNWFRVTTIVVLAATTLWHLSS